MSGSQIDALPHSACGSKKGLKVFLQDDGTVNGWCFSCHSFFPQPYGEEVDVVSLKERKQKTLQEKEAEVAEVAGYTTVDVPSRKLRAKDLELFEAKTSLSETDGISPTAIYFPISRDGKHTGYHVKMLPNAEGIYPDVKAFNLGDTKGADLLNWENARASGSYRLIITEGPEDMVSVGKIYKTYGDPAYFPAVCSLPAGSGSAKKVLQKHAADIERTFKEVVLCFDDDDSGHRAVKDARLVLPNAKSVTLPRKDANQCIIDGVTKAAYNQLAYHTEVPKNTRIVYAESLHEAAREPAKYGELSYPFHNLNEATRGIRYGETTYFGAGVKMGKSELLNELACHFIRAHDAKVFMAKPEESNKKTYKLLANKIANTVFHDPKREFDYEAFDKAGKVLAEHAAMLDIYQHLGWDSLKQDIKAACEWGANAIFIDPITNLTNGINAGDANTILQGFGEELSAMAKDFNFAAFIFCHLKAHDGNISRDQRNSYYKSEKYIGLGNCSHEYGGDIYSSQFAGSRGMMRSCNYMIGLEGNKDPELPDGLRNIRHLKLLEDREFGESGIFPVYWDKNTTRFTEM